jgi:predicted transport protein
MKAEDIRLTQLLEGPKQFIVPVFQRDYSWGTKHCLQLWKDVARVGSDDTAKAHFVGSVVYIAAEDIKAPLARWLLIDGQQRLTTLTLLLAALRNRLPAVAADAQPPEDVDLPSRVELEDYYLCNTHGKGDRRYKLHLRRVDQETLTALIDGKPLPKGASDCIVQNFEFFTERLASADLGLVYRGITKLVAVDVSLTRGQDDPQMIFESLNSTGLDLTQADLIRNFVLMRQEEEPQTRLYQDYWQPIEAAFGPRYRTDFDKFVRDYLTIRLRPAKQFKADEIYQQFRNYFHGLAADTTIEALLADLKRFGGYYASFSFGHEEQTRLREVLRRLRQLVEVASPVILRLYDCYARARTLSLDEFVAAVELLESYVFRRSVCDMQTRSLGQIFSSLAYRVREEAPLLSLKVALHRQGKKRRFPTDAEFREALETRDVYDMRHCHYLLDRLENDSREKIDTSSFSIEHVMPQNPDLRPEWQAMLGPEWKTVQEVWLHRLGNITLTAYNSPYSDRPFVEKQTTPKGFNESPLRLNKFIREQQTWTPAQMEKRGKDLAARALSIWPALVADVEAVKTAELEELKAAAARYCPADLEFDSTSKGLFEKLRPQVLGEGEDVVELCGPKSVTYRVYDFFLEVIPRKKRLTLLLNLDFEECDDPAGAAIDATEYAFITHASESGGVLFRLDDVSQIGTAMHLIRQAYQKVSE